MNRLDDRFYRLVPPSLKAKRITGRLIVIEGTDGVGRSSQIALLREWLEGEGYPITVTGLKRGRLARKGMQQAMEGHTLSDTTMTLLYATDLMDRLEHEIVPAMRAGFIVLTDRYIYSIIVRGLVRGLDPDWVRNVFAFALIPDRIFYLKADIKNLVPRVLNARGFDYWESGLDFQHTRDYYNSYVRYQERLMERFDEVSEEFGFVHVDANRSIPEVFHDLQAGISELLVDMHAKAEQEEAKQKGKKKKGGKSNKS